jgi:hypothetical protein
MYFIYNIFEYFFIVAYIQQMSDKHLAFAKRLREWSQNGLGHPIDIARAIVENATEGNILEAAIAAEKAAIKMAAEEAAADNNPIISVRVVREYSPKTLAAIKYLLLHIWFHLKEQVEEVRIRRAGSPIVANLHVYFRTPHGIIFGRNFGWHQCISHYNNNQCEDLCLGLCGLPECSFATNMQKNSYFPQLKKRKDMITFGSILGDRLRVKHDVPVSEINFDELLGPSMALFVKIFTDYQNTRNYDFMKHIGSFL